MPLDYSTYEEGIKNYKHGDRWDEFDGTQENFNIAHECIDRHIEKGIGFRVKFSDGSSETYTFKEVSQYTSQFANAISRLGINKGDCVVMVDTPSLEFYVTFFGTMKRGAVIVPCSPLFGPEAIEYRLRDTQAKLLIMPENEVKSIDTSLVKYLVTKEEFREFIKDENREYRPATSSEDLAMLHFSSGTTGRPKGIPYKHRAIVFYSPTAKFTYGMEKGDKYFCPSPPGWGHSIWGGIFSPLIYGVATGAYSGKFDAEKVLEALDEFKIRSISAAPSLYRRLLATGKIKDYNLKIEKLSYTGEPIDSNTCNQLQEQFGVIPYGMYGATEVGLIASDFLGFKDWKVKPGSLGKPFFGLKVAIIDGEGNELPPGEVGEIAVKRRGEWLRIGDAGLVDEEGYFWHKGRSDDVIISAGYTIGPYEIEDVINKHEAVEESAVVGVPHKDRGHIVKAFIKLKPVFEPSEEIKGEIQEYVKSRLSKHEYPREIEFIAEIPKTEGGKIQRKKLRGKS